MAQRESLQQSLEQRQQQTLTPLQLQYARILEMNQTELGDEVQRALDENPALERDDEINADNQTGTDEDGNPFDETAEQLQMADYASPDDAPDTPLPRQAPAQPSTWRPDIADISVSLMEHLMQQLRQDRQLTPRQMTIAEAIVGNIDDNGYLSRAIHAIISDLGVTEGIDVSDSEARQVWDIIRTLDPAGVGAADMRDALLMQLYRLKPSPVGDIAIEILRSYYDLFSLMHFNKLRSALGVDEHTLRQAYELIQTLNPKPGVIYSDTNPGTDTAQIIHPDFAVENDGDRLSVTLLDTPVHLRIEETFKSDTPIPQHLSKSSQARHQAANLFKRQRRDDASNFIRALDMRSRTLMRVMSAIVQLQRDFFISGDDSTLRPMILKDVAAVTGDDLSVISRATAGKYVATASGIYPLRHFFNEKVNDTSDITSASVMKRLRDIISTESSSKPYSDEALTQILNNEGFDVARRTVAKYRERMGLPVGRLRKKI